MELLQGLNQVRKLKKALSFTIKPFLREHYMNLYILGLVFPLLSSYEIKILMILQQNNVVNHRKVVVKPVKIDVKQKKRRRVLRLFQIISTKNLRIHCGYNKFLEILGYRNQGILNHDIP